MSKKTPINPWHAANGGKLVDFAGWELPVQYGGGIIHEHLTVRKFGGLFDICHMGRFLISGPGGLDFLERSLTNSAAKLAVGEAQYTLICNEEGRPLDDAFTYRLKEDEYLLVVNAANKDKDWAWLNRLDLGGASLEDKSSELAMIAVQGPQTARLLAGLARDGLPAWNKRNGGWITLAGVECFACRTGYTGEPVSYELFMPGDRALGLWTELAIQGAGLGVEPAGLGARDTLRLEAGLPLYGHEYSEERPALSVPLARYGMDLYEGRPDFPGKAALMAQAKELAEGKTGLVPQRVLKIAGPEKGMMREGSQVLQEGEPVGELTSATMVPAWLFEGDEPGDESGKRLIGMALVERKVKSGQTVEVKYRKRSLEAKAVSGFIAYAGDYVRPKQF